ncbi:hypothetical protein HQ533_05555 [Candidatus Woesearchaeota archaeon]|nr:hypothetical protein [Candidatus Woesearchaeota archaeon]
MKRGWLVLTIFLMITAAFVSAKTDDMTGCWGVKLCSGNHTCGINDSICPDDFFLPGSGATCFLDPESPPLGYMKCIDPDCWTCVDGSVFKADDPTKPIVGATITYSQDLTNGTNWSTVIITAVTDDNGLYNMDVPAGNEIIVHAEAVGFTPDMSTFFDVKQTDPCLNVNFLLYNGTCESDCTRTGSNFCDASCQGQGPDGTCSFNTETTYEADDGQTINLLQTPMEACTEFGVQTGSFVDVANFTDLTTEKRMCVRVMCCQAENIFEVPCPEPGVTESLNLVTGTLEDAIKVTRIARYKGEAVKIRVYYWE